MKGDCAIARHQTLLDSWGVATSGPRIIYAYNLPDLPRLLRAKDEKRKSKDEGRTKIDGRRTKNKNQRRKSADENCTTRPPYVRAWPVWIPP